MKIFFKCCLSRKPNLIQKNLHQCRHSSEWKFFDVKVEMDKYYSTDQISTFNALKSRWNLKTKVGPEENRWIIVRRVSRAKSMRVFNPFFSYYQDNTYRKELPVLYPYQIGFLCERGFLPTGFNLSHTCALQNKSKKSREGLKCVVASHMVVETSGTNRSRERCFTAIRKNIARAKKRKRFQTWSYNLCNHDPVCFINTGLIWMTLYKLFIFENSVTSFIYKLPQDLGRPPPF